MLAIASFWAVMWGLLIRTRLARPGPRQLAPNYSRLLEPDEEKRSSTWGIYFGDLRIGRSEMTIQREAVAIVVRNETRIKLGPGARYLMGTVGTLDVDFQAEVSPLRGLLSFRVKSEKLQTDMHGAVMGEQISLTGRMAGERVSSRIPFSQERLLGQAFSPLTALPELDEDQVGLVWNVQMVNPMAGGVQRVTAEIVHLKEVQIDGEDVQAFQFSFASGSARWSSWVSREGEVLVQGTPFGLVLKREDLPEQAAAELSAVAPAPQPVD